ncbi:TPA: hypothetical protein ACFONT_000881 [Neisseria meningitidis]|nr:hypothetical protein [Neisseria meningitidis]MBG9007869.1 hypothetical protein [Neisseria meningitidis]MBG9064503.1 hypothetical protein [Neisseria meningitidis]MBG9072277.1 hypothetical protein [Neisseria meningitidis]MBG9074587.1 hypothetical protein [Neisseria meningitidis]MBG9076549.1 hypothetical protein [Neisseria meningitidis]
METAVPRLGGASGRIPVPEQARPAKQMPSETEKGFRRHFSAVCIQA